MSSISQTLPLHGVQLVEASAGTGKTYTIATLFVRLLLERGVNVEDILVVTYTRAATAELQERIRLRLTDALDAWSAGTEPSDDSLRALWSTRSSAQRIADIKRLRVALGNYDRAAISTIHGFCQRVLQEHAFQSQSPLAPELLMTERPLLQEVVHDVWARHAYHAPRILFDAIKVPTLLKTLLRVALDTVHRRDATIVPTRPTHVEIPSADAFHAAKQRLRQTWQAHGAETIDLLCKWPNLNQNTYKYSAIAESWPKDIGDYLNGTDVTPPKELRKLSTAELRDSTKGGATPPTLVISRDVDALLIAAQPVTDAVEQWKLQLRLDLITEVRTEIDRRKREHDQLAFDDLLRQLRDAVSTAEGAALVARLRQTYPVALVDEFQDTDPVQYAIFRALYADAGPRCGLFLIGDPKQAIYRFRGADVFAYMDAVNAVGGQPHRLLDNWRSDPRLLEGINAVFTQHRQPFAYEAIGFSPATPAPTAKNRLSGPDTWTIPLCFTLPPDDTKLSAGAATTWAVQTCAAHIGHTLSAGLLIDGVPVRPRDIAVLCRTNKQAADVQAALRALRIPTARDGDASVFETPTALDLERVLNAVAQPDDGVLLRVALATSIIGLDAAALLALDDERDSQAWESWVTRVHEWNQLWLQRGLTPMLQRLLAQQQVHARLLQLTDGERRLTDLMHLTELLQRHASEHHTGPLSLVSWLQTLRLDDEARIEVDEAQIRLESDAHAVKLTTIHRSKGLEYPIVYCPFLWSTTGIQRSKEEALVFHTEASAASLTIDVSGDKPDAHTEIAKHESLAEDVRLAYVALTRARHRCVVSFCTVDRAPKNVLMHLLSREEASETKGKRTKDKANAPALSPVRATLQALCAAHPEAVAIEDRALPTPPDYRDSGARAITLKARLRTRRLPPGLRITSFSRLIERDARLGREAEEGHDHDTRLLPPITAPVPSPARTEIALADVEAGAQIGLLVHDVLEHSDFSLDARQLLIRRMQTMAPRHGVDSETAQHLARGVAAALDARLGTGPLGFSLADLALTERLAEVEFMFPVTHELTAQRLADVLAKHDPTLTGDDYVGRLRGLGFQAFAGYLRGYIDLCFQRDGRFYVLDYKTNHLGRHVDDYAPGSLQRAMADHHYYLQALVYSVALHRYLRLRLRDYDYAQHFGGFLYVFVRGMAPDHPPGSGVLHGCPSLALMHELSALFGGGVA